MFVVLVCIKNNTLYGVLFFLEAFYSLLIGVHGKAEDTAPAMAHSQSPIPAEP